MLLVNDRFSIVLENSSNCTPIVLLGGAGAVTGLGLVRATWPVSGRPLRHVVSRRDGEDLHRPVLRRNAAHSEKAPTTLLD